MCLNKLNEEVEILTNKFQIHTGNNIVDSYDVIKDKALKTKDDAYSNLNYCENLIKLLKKYKSRIDTFTGKHIIPLSNLLDENYTDVHNLIIKEVQYFHQLNLKWFKNENLLNTGIYSFGSFNYSNDVLQKVNLYKKSDIFCLYYKFIFALNANSKSKDLEIKMRQIALKSDHFFNFIRNYEKIIDFEYFLTKELPCIINSYLNDNNSKEKIIKSELNKIDRYKKIIKLRRKIFDQKF